MNDATEEERWDKFFAGTGLQLRWGRKGRATAPRDGWAALEEIWEGAGDVPGGGTGRRTDSLKELVDLAPSRVLVRVWCAVHKQTLVAAVLRTPANEPLLLTTNVDLNPQLRIMWGHSDAEEPPSPETPETPGRRVFKRLVLWTPEPTFLREQPQPDLFCARCNAPRPCSDLLDIATKASKTHRADIHA